MTTYKIFILKQNPQTGSFLLYLFGKLSSLLKHKLKVFQHLYGSTFAYLQAQQSHHHSGLVAQWIRHLTTNQGIAGSSPAKIKSFFLSLILFRFVIKLVMHNDDTETLTCSNKT